MKGLVNDMYEIEKIIEELLDEGMPDHLVGKVETLIVNKHGEAEKWKEKYKELRLLQSWDENPERMGQ